MRRSRQPLVPRRRLSPRCPPCRAQHTVVGGRSQPKLLAAAEEVGHALRVLASSCQHNADMALEMLRVEVPAPANSDPADADARGADLLTLACQAVAVLAKLPGSSCSILGGWVGGWVGVGGGRQLQPGDPRARRH